MEQNWEPRNKLLHMQIKYLTGELTILNGGKTVSSINNAGKLDICMQKNEARSLPYSAHKN